jgi:hypothetical protein
VTQENFIIELFCRVDDMLLKTQEHNQAKLSKSELVTLGLLLALPKRSYLNHGFTAAQIAIKVCGSNDYLSTYNLSRSAFLLVSQLVHDCFDIDSEII